ncbi:MAG: hypothetical protein QNJ51_21290 [Calothrix sp. MO_167.B12]|nr:hypothetical protein [Calothrix sp. MO_167.B12]
MARIIISELSYGLIHQKKSEISFVEDINCQNLIFVYGGKNNDFDYLLNYLAAGLAIYSIKSITDLFD